MVALELSWTCLPEHPSMVLWLRWYPFPVTGPISSPLVAGTNGINGYTWHVNGYFNRNSAAIIMKNVLGFFIAMFDDDKNQGLQTTFQTNPSPSGASKKRGNPLAIVR